MDRDPDTADLGPYLDCVDRWLGSPSEEHPRTSALVAYVDGELSAAERTLIRDHLDGCAPCQALIEAARAGLDEAASVEAALRALSGPAGFRDSAEPSLVWPLPVQVPATLRALAHDPADQEAPLPHDRQVLWQGPQAGSLVYFREGWQGRLAWFGPHPQDRLLSARLDGRPLPVLVQDAETLVLDLGPTRRLPGQTLEVRLRSPTVPTRTLDRSFRFTEA